VEEGDEAYGILLGIYGVLMVNELPIVFIPLYF